MITFQNTYQLIQGKRHFDFKLCYQFISEQGLNVYGANFQLRPDYYLTLYKLLIYAIKDQKQCEKYGIDLNKNILLMGEELKGKTSLMHLIKPFFYPKENYTIRSAREFSRHFFQQGYDSLEKYTVKEHKNLCIDDVGKEMTSKHYGASCEVVSELVFMRTNTLDRQQSTHIITHFDASSLEKKYGSDFRNLLRTHYNQIIL